MRTLKHGWRLTAAALAFVAAGALAQEATESSDELAGAIAQSLETIEFQVTVTPDSAARDLEAQRRRLELLELESPDHPMLPELIQRIEALESRAAAALSEGEEPGVDDDSGMMLAIDPPPELRSRMREIENLQVRADRELMLGEREAAAHYLDEADSAIDRVEEEFGEQIPPGYASLIVAKERLDALRDQLADTAAD